jgi:hypothetical protein
VQDDEPIANYKRYPFGCPIILILAVTNEILSKIAPIILYSMHL